jgi:hypothetical protein
MTARKALLLLLVVPLISTAHADGLESTSHVLTGERPDPPGTVTPVSIEIYFVDIDEIDDASQRFRVDMFVLISWQDPRLASPEHGRSGQVRTIPLDKIWTPRGLIVNDRGLSFQLPRIADVDGLGNVTYRQRVSGPLAANLDFEEFPFDVQLLPIHIVSYKYFPDEVTFTSKSGIVRIKDSFSAEGWELRILDPVVNEVAVPSHGIVRPSLTFFIEAKRDPKYCLLTMVLPMAPIALMAWTAFWLQPNIVNPRLGISTAAIFSLIALGVSIRLGLPPISYLTRADLFVIGCTLLVFLSLGVSVAVIRWGNADQMERALRLNRAARWIYLVLFGVVITTTMVL